MKKCAGRWLPKLITSSRDQICTIGPKSNSVEVLNKLRNAGLNVVRM